MRVSPLDFYDVTTGAEVQCQYGGSAITIRRVYCPEESRQMGGATRLMREVCKAADRVQSNLVLYVVPDPDSPLDVDGLVKFYKHFGFKREPGLQHGEPVCMIRLWKGATRRWISNWTLDYPTNQKPRL